MKDKNTVMKLASVFFWIILWELIARNLDSNLILPAPSKVLKALMMLIREPEFLKSIMNTLSRIWVGFFGAFLLGILFGYISHHISFLRFLLQPIITGMKSIPIASFIILALIWIGADALSTLTAALVTFPVIYINTMEGLGTKDKKLLEIARVYRFSKLKEWIYIDWMALKPFLISGSKIAIGMSWKSGIAAEVIGIPKFSIGEQFYMSKIYLNTTELFAWTVVVVLLSIASERLMLLVFRIKGEEVFHGREGIDHNGGESPREFENMILKIDRLCKSYQEKVILNQFSMKAGQGDTCCFMEESGKGKTTLFRLIMGLETADSGTIEYSGMRISAVFQEDRLFEELTPISNIKIACDFPISKAEIKKHLVQVLPEDCISKPVKALSGGMKRRVAVVRAILSGSEILIMDEPFSGLDEHTKERVIQYIQTHRQGRLLLYATHDIKEQEQMGGVLVCLKA